VAKRQLAFDERKDLMMANNIQRIYFNG